MTESTHRVVRQVTEHECTLYGPIRFYRDYMDLIDGLNSATANDVVRLNINSPGGNVDVGMMIIKALEQTEATVIARVIWPSASMASLIALSCDSLVFDKYTHLMFHTYSSGNYGKSNEYMMHAKEWHECLVGQFDDILYPFLSKSELKRMHEGQDIYVKWNDQKLLTRMTKHFKIIPDYLKSGRYEKG